MPAGTINLHSCSPYTVNMKGTGRTSSDSTGASACSSDTDGLLRTCPVCSEGPGLTYDLRALCGLWGEVILRWVGNRDHKVKLNYIAQAGFDMSLMDTEIQQDLIKMMLKYFVVSKRSICFIGKCVRCLIYPYCNVFYDSIKNLLKLTTC